MKALVMGLVSIAWAVASVADDAALIQKQFVEYFVRGGSHESAAARNMGNIRPDGTWPDIDYASQRRGGWPTLAHLRRLEGMAVVYSDSDAKLHQAPELKRSIVSGLNHWIDKDYRNPNWWYARIGVPQSLGATMLLLGEDLPDESLERARPILLRSKMGMTGQNKVWCAGNNVMIGLIYDEPNRIEQAAAAIWSELRVSTEEGIQPDWSFHQHGPQQQFGNYGFSFASDMIKWALILRGTEHELSGEKRSNLRNYMLEGVSWIIWNGRMDFSGCGRQIDEGALASKGRGTIRQLDLMKRVDPEFAGAYSDVLQRNGFNSFWRSEMAVQRRPEWYASVKMSSTRVIGAETCNSENMRGLHLGDGAMLVYQSGNEYEDIVPVWDWKRLPGTTCDQGFDDLTPKGASNGYGGSDFSGVLGDGQTGVAAMIYQRGGLAAHKAWFFLEDEIVCLGAGISGDTQGDVITSIQQSWATGEVTKGEGWVHHGHLGYVGKGMISSMLEVEGNWLAAFPTRGDRPATGTVFSAWIEHGKSPNSEGYAYRVYPNVAAEDMKRIAEDQHVRIIAHSKSALAIQTTEGVWAVFFEPGGIKTTSGKMIKVDQPCLLMVSKEQLVVADPRHAIDAVNVTVSGKRRHIPLPDGEAMGSQVEVRF